MKQEFAEIFNLVKKDIGDTAFAGDDIHMKSVAPYGIPSGIPELDLYLGARGGLPASKVIEYYGKQWTGKTTAAMQAGAEWQKRGGLVFWIDSERSFDPRRATEVGLDPKAVIKSEPDTIEEIFDHTMKGLDILEKKNFDKPVLFAVDSITGVPTQADVDGNIDASDRPGYEAKQIKRGLKKINHRFGELVCKPSIIFVNHAIAKIGVSFGRKSDSGGGSGIKFYSSVRLSFTHTATIKDGDRRTGQKIQIEIEKFRGHLEYPKFKVDLTNDCGFDKYKSLHNAMVATGYADKPARAQVTTVLPGTDKEEQFKNTLLREWIEQKGGYDKVYAAWRKHVVNEGIIIPWGS